MSEEEYAGDMGGRQAAREAEIEAARIQAEADELARRAAASQDVDPYDEESEPEPEPDREPEPEPEDEDPYGEEDPPPPVEVEVEEEEKSKKKKKKKIHQEHLVEEQLAEAIHMETHM